MIGNTGGCLLRSRAALCLVVALGWSLAREWAPVSQEVSYPEITAPKRRGGVSLFGKSKTLGCSRLAFRRHCHGLWSLREIGLQRKLGDPRYQPDRFDYDYTNIFRSTQDADIMLDGTPEQAEELEAVLREKFGHLQGSKEIWEVRLLRDKRGDKDALLNNPDFLNQHTDSNSIGMIELTPPPKGEPIVRDLRDWKTKYPAFFEDLRLGKLHYYFSPKHIATPRFQEGKNDPILSVIRYLRRPSIRVEIMPADWKNSVDYQSLQPQSVLGHALGRWGLYVPLDQNGKKLIQHAVNVGTP